MPTETQDKAENREASGIDEAENTRLPGQASSVVASAAGSTQSSTRAPTGHPDVEPRINAEFSNISLNQKIEGQSSPKMDDEAGRDPPGSTLKAPADVEASQLPSTHARIPSLGFFQDEDDDTEGKFTLDDGEMSPQPSFTEGRFDSAQALPVAVALDNDENGVLPMNPDGNRAQDETLPSNPPPQSAGPPSPAKSAHLDPLPMPPPGIEPEEFKGLLFYDGMDNKGRPVVVINVRAEAMLQAKLRSKAMAYMTARLEPIVRQGPYVLILVASGHQGDTSSKLPAWWLIKAYRSLSRPYKKNVKFIVLVRPSAMLRALLVVLRPFLSLKAARKLHKVDSLLDIDTATGSEITAESTGPKFLREELGVEPGSLLPPVEARQRAEQLDAEVQLGTF